MPSEEVRIEAFADILRRRLAERCCQPAPADSVRHRQAPSTEHQAPSTSPIHFTYLQSPISNHLSPITYPQLLISNHLSLISNHQSRDSPSTRAYVPTALEGGALRESVAQLLCARQPPRLKPLPAAPPEVIASRRTWSHYPPGDSATLHRALPLPPRARSRCTYGWGDQLDAPTRLRNPFDPYRISDSISAHSHGFVALAAPIARHACAPDGRHYPVALVGVLNYSPHAQTFSFDLSNSSVRRSLDVARALSDALGACGVEHRWISRPNPDADLCYLLTARRFVPSFGGFSALPPASSAGALRLRALRGASSNSESSSSSASPMSAYLCV